MKFSISWLKNYLAFDASLDELCAKLTAIGLEVEGVLNEAESLSYFEVAKIIEAKKHENSDKLSICSVQKDSGEILQIVCGAKNARAGIKVALAVVGAVIPANKMVIKKAKVAGVESNGMLCSASELGLGADSEGIIEIDEKWDLGTKIAEIYGKNDAVIEINITPNRGDCLGVFGIARDLAAAGFGKLIAPEISKINSQFQSKINAKISADDACKMALFREIRNVKNQESPLWLKEKLAKIGQNSISAIVDITNYVMFSLGNPMHSYDASKIKGNIDIRFAKNQEKFLSLKNENYLLNEDILTICDEENILSIAGIIGSKDSSCEIETQNILLEAAFFDKIAVANSARKVGILSDAKYRFERGVDYKNCQLAIEMASALIVEICGGNASDIIEIKSQKFDENLKEIVFDFNKIEKLTSLKIAQNKVEEILKNLGFILQKNENEKYLVKIPSSRSDVEGEADLVEEVVRIFGYEKILSQKIEINSGKNSVDIFDNVRQKLIAKSFIETINWSFCDEKIAKNFYEIKDVLKLLNPISQELSIMRSNLILGLIKTYQKNSFRTIDDLSIFEIGNVFNLDKEITQSLVISGLRAGRNKEKNHYNDDYDFDIFDVKKDVFDILEVFAIKEKSIEICDKNAPIYYHPHRFAALKLGKNLIGYFGEIHPKIAKIFDIKKTVNIFEIFVDNFPKNIFEKKFIAKKPLNNSDFQPIYRDFAFLIDKNQKIGDLTKTIENCDKNLIKQVDIFDIYQGENIAQDKKSVALRVVIYPIDKNLDGNEIEAISLNIIKNVAEKNNAILRS